jgi:hypothetical protein
LILGLLALLTSARAILARPDNRAWNSQESRHYTGRGNDQTQAQTESGDYHLDFPDLKDPMITSAITTPSPSAKPSGISKS